MDFEIGVEVAKLRSCEEKLNENNLLFLLVRYISEKVISTHKIGRNDDENVRMCFLVIQRVPRWWVKSTTKILAQI